MYNIPAILHNINALIRITFGIVNTSLYITNIAKIKHKDFQLTIFASKSVTNTDPNSTISFSLVLRTINVNFLDIPYPYSSHVTKLMTHTIPYIIIKHLYNRDRYFHFLNHSYKTVKTVAFNILKAITPIHIPHA